LRFGTSSAISPCVVARLTKSAEAIPWRGNEIAMHLSGACNGERGEAQDDKDGICRASLALDRSGPRGCLKSALVGEGLVPSQFAGAYKGLPYGSFRHVNRLLINVLQVFLHIN